MLHPMSVLDPTNLVGHLPKRVETITVNIEIHDCNINRGPPENMCAFIMYDYSYILCLYMSIYDVVII